MRRLIVVALFAFAFIACNDASARPPAIAGAAAGPDGATSTR